jgi:hypothetical protein
MPSCGFCGVDGQSQEHLWARWVLGGKTISYPNRSLQLTVGMPCEPCNNGWMSDLENDVKPFMTSMAFRGEKTLLDEERQAKLVRWFVKTAMVNEYTAADSEQKYFTEAERRAFKEQFTIPANLWIWLARYDGVLPLHSVQLRAPKGAPFLYSLTFGSNFLVGQLFAHRDPEFRRYADATRGLRLQQLYPSLGAWISWPPENTIDDHELQVLDYRFTKAIGGKVDV